MITKISTFFKNSKQNLEQKIKSIKPLKPETKEKIKIIALNLLIISVLLLVLYGIYNLVLGNMASNAKYIKLKVDNGEAVIMDRKQIEFLNLVPNMHYDGTMKKDDKIIKKLNINTDANGFRKTPENFDPNKGPIVFFGCSYIFGYGLNDNETFPWDISELTHRQTYNVSFPGFGPQHMLRHLQQKDFIKKVPKADLIVYTYMVDHVARLEGPPFIDDLMYYPKYELKNGKLSYIAPSDEYVKNVSIRRHLNEIDFIKMKNANIKDPNLRKLYVAVLKESQRLSKEMYPNSRFVVLDLENVDDLDKMLKDEGIEVIELKDIFPEPYYPKYVIKYDCHPTAKFWQLIGPKFVEKLGI